MDVLTYKVQPFMDVLTYKVQPVMDVLTKYNLLWMSLLTNHNLLWISLHTKHLLWMSLLTKHNLLRVSLHGFVGLGINAFPDLCVHHFCVPCCVCSYEHLLKSNKPSESLNMHQLTCPCVKAELHKSILHDNGDEVATSVLLLRIVQNDAVITAAWFEHQLDADRQQSILNRRVRNEGGLVEGGVNHSKACEKDMHKLSQ